MPSTLDAGNLTAGREAAVESRKRVVIVDDDALFRESLGLNLVENGYEIDDFGDGESALRHFADGGSADAILLDWRMPGVDGLAVLRRLRDHDVQIPVIFLTVLSDEIYEEAALRWGAVDFIEKSRSLSIILQRLRLITDGPKRANGTDAPAGDPGAAYVRGKLELRNDINRAFYDGKRVDLTLTEFQIVRLLAGTADTDVSYRQIYDLVRGKDFIAGYGEEGYRVNVRSFIKRIRQKFRDVDDTFSCIENYPGFGYRWVDAD
ncbi:MAG TPA: response regulator transcription factor [Candidatus Acidoferrum sp.]|nr:response regulator transcription factor [Candidatus Acidoferrum sp.]